MDNTNIEEANSDAAAYGLVALCDQPYDEINTQFSEEVVETSGQVVAAEIVDNTSVKIFVQNIGQPEIATWQRQCISSAAASARI